LVSFPQGSYHVDSVARQIEVNTGFIGSAGGGPQRAQTLTLGWDGAAMRAISQRYQGAPEYRFQAAQDGWAAVAQRDWAAASASFARLTDASLPMLVLSGDQAQAEATLAALAVYGQLIAGAGQGGAAYGTAKARLSGAAADSPWTALAGVLQTSFDATSDLSAACERVRAAWPSVVGDMETAVANAAYWPDVGYANVLPSALEICPF
jgi:hypothetical protein